VKVLAIETSSARGCVALLDEGGLVSEQSLGEGSRHGQALVPCIDELLGGERSVDLVAVSAGPGSYTGLRVGITFAKTFCVQTGTPVVTVSSLDAIAANYTGPGRLCVVLDARLGQVYAALYDKEHHKTVGDIAASPEDVAAGVEPGKTVVIGDGLRRYRDIFAAAGEVIDDESVWWPRAASVGRLGRDRFNRDGGEDPRALVPRYLRRPQAEVTWEETQGAPGPK